MGPMLEIVSEVMGLKWVVVGGGPIPAAGGKLGTIQ